MNVSLTPKLEKMVRDKVESGLYNNASEVIREALRLLDQKDRSSRKLLVDSLIQDGNDDLASGRVHPVTPELRQQIHREALQMHAAKEPVANYISGQED